MPRTERRVPIAGVNSTLERMAAAGSAISEVVVVWARDQVRLHHEVLLVPSLRPGQALGIARRGGPAISACAVEPLHSVDLKRSG